MPYVRILVHIVWTTKNKERVLEKEFRKELFDHIRANAKSKGIFLDTIGGHWDHVHSLVYLQADQPISKIAQLLKGESSHWANQEKKTLRKFEWQDEYWAASVNECDAEAVRRYIRNQEEHHTKKSEPEEWEKHIGGSSFERRGG